MRREAPNNLVGSAISLENAGASPVFSSELLHYEMRTRAGASLRTSSTTGLEGRLNADASSAAPEGRGASAPSNLVGSAI